MPEVWLLDGCRTVFFQKPDIECLPRGDLTKCAAHWWVLLGIPSRVLSAQAPVQASTMAWLTLPVTSGMDRGSCLFIVPDRGMDCRGHHVKHRLLGVQGGARADRLEGPRRRPERRGAHLQAPLEPRRPPAPDR